MLNEGGRPFRVLEWTKEYGFLLDVIQEACDKTVMTTDRNRFAYADGILTKWYQAGVHHKSDIPVADASFKRTKSQNSDNKNGDDPTDRLIPLPFGSGRVRF